jgi:hypothetical protein
MRTGLVACRLACGLALVFAGACTVFNGLDAQPDGEPLAVDGGQDDASVAANDSGGMANQARRMVHPGDGYLPLADGARLCSRVAECPLIAASFMVSMGLSVPTTNFAACVDLVSGRLPPTRVGVALQTATLACVAAARSCAEAGRCVPYESIADEDPRCAHASLPDGGWQNRCDGNGTVVNCAYDQVLHCEHSFFGPGARCIVGDDGVGACGLDKNCATGPSDCLGTLYEFCNGGNVRQTWECPLAGYVCGPDETVDGGGSSVCTQSGHVKACTTVGARCIGDVVSVCDGDNYSEYDCKALGAKCEASEGVPRCRRADDECTPLDVGIDACASDGTEAIALCVSGKRATFDCASIGLRCVASPGARGSCAR